jgi:D-alanine-D-alanine ligase
VADAIDKNKYNPILIGIDNTGKWFLCDTQNFLLDAEDPKRIRLNAGRAEAALIPQSGGSVLNLLEAKTGATIDVAFPILHGPFGEDGTAQGLLKLANLPFVGSGVLGSAIGMDKDVMKRLLRDAGIPVGKFMAVKSHEEVPPFDTITRALGLPFFVKPANMGSSVGVSKVRGESEYMDALKEAFAFDVKIIIEEFIKGREIECAVLGNEDPKPSVPGEVIPAREFYSYDAKYIDECGAALEIPAKINARTTRLIQDLAVKTFKTLECAGLGRVDFFLKDNGSVLVNEINTMPGFTRISMYPKLWEAGGVSYAALIDRLIELAFSRFENERKLLCAINR